MWIDRQDLPTASPGRQISLTALRFGQAGARPKAYLQAGLHADEMPGPLILHHLRGLLEQAEAAGQIKGALVLVPMANPIGFAQWVSHKPQGRQELESMQNFNRGYPDLASLLPELSADLTDSVDDNTRLIRAAFAQALQNLPCADENTSQRRALMMWSHDADHVLDLHCDHFAVPHLYASPARPKETAVLSAAMGAKVALIAAVSGGNAFDEAHTAPWLALQARYGDRFPIAAATFSTTLEYRGQFDVADAQAAEDARRLMIYLAAMGVVDGPAQPPDPAAPERPLSGALEGFAPQGGIVTWAVPVGQEVVEGQVLAHVTDPVTGLRMGVASPCDGLLFRQELWRSCLRGQSLFHVAGSETLREGDLLSD